MSSEFFFFFALLVQTAHDITDKKSKHFLRRVVTENTRVLEPPNDRNRRRPFCFIFIFFYECTRKIRRFRDTEKDA